ncbi:MAG TPA: SCP2 sterol-binding domain-containing protein [Anaerolineae bacterium]|nr:SCP2 sterol-binding domain-containing protein [Anaerolineae bacterium]HQJ50322.1 SCP2 sterol-binding domain-containing protein [Anaerolineae bacterium]
MFKFASDEWVQALKQAINSSPAYAEAAKTWEGDFYFIVEPSGPVAQELVMYMDLWHGECREAQTYPDRSAKQPAFVISAPLPVWRKVIDKKLDPIQGMMTRQIKLQGDMVKIMKAVKAAKELVECTTRVPTQFPE